MAFQDLGVDPAVLARARQLRPFASELADSRAAGMMLKETLGARHLNLVTVESLTAGMIAKTMVDTSRPTNAVLYGGFIVYDTDAKRQWANVTTTGVYNAETAVEMAKGALINSRAMVALSVTGQAMPYPDEAEKVGKVDIGVAIRFEGGIKTFTKRFNAKENSDIIAEWELQNRDRSKLGRNFAPSFLTTQVAEIVRLRTTTQALLYADAIVKANVCVSDDSACAKPALGVVKKAGYDSCSQRSWYIDQHARGPSHYDKKNVDKYAPSSGEESTALPCAVRKKGARN